MINTLFTLYEDEDISIYDLKIKRNQDLSTEAVCKKNRQNDIHSLCKGQITSRCKR